MKNKNDKGSSIYAPRLGGGGGGAVKPVNV